MAHKYKPPLGLCVTCGKPAREHESRSGDITAEDIRYKFEAAFTKEDRLGYLSSVIGDIILWIEEQEK